MKIFCWSTYQSWAEPWKLAHACFPINEVTNACLPTNTNLINILGIIILITYNWKIGTWKYFAGQLIKAERSLEN